MRVTEKQIKKEYENIISVGYCNLQGLLRYFNRDYNTCGVYGWNADIYKINYNTCIVTGYRPFGNIHASYNGICNKYEKKIEKVNNDNTITYEKKKAKATKLLQKFVDECLKI